MGTASASSRPSENSEERADTQSCLRLFHSPITYEGCRMIKIDKYESVLEQTPLGAEVCYYAVAGKNRYKMPDCYKEMYTDDYLAIKERKMAMPELFGLDETENVHYIPLRTKL